MDEIEIPSYFLCPISMQLMRDPVTVSTGITYDRESIEKWIFSCKNKTCPVTKQEIVITDLTPNHTLRRLIQAWCTLNASNGIERIPTPKPPTDKTQIVKLLNEAKKSPEAQIKCLRRLRSIAHKSEGNKKLLESAGALDFLATIIKTNNEVLLLEEDSDSVRASDLALNVLHQLDPEANDLKKLINDNGEFLDSLLRILKYGNVQSRAHAIMLLNSMCKVADPGWLIGAKMQLFVEIVRVLRDKISQQASKAALKLLVDVCPWGRNRIKAVDGGAVFVLIELLLNSSERRVCELVLTILDLLCGCAEGRAELLKHGAGLAIVSKKILRVSHVGTDRGVKILSAIARFSGTSRVTQEMLQVGVVSKLCLVLQVESNQKTKERAKDILRLHSRVWKDSSCVPAHLFSSYP